MPPATVKQHLAVRIIGLHFINDQLSCCVEMIRMIFEIIQPAASAAESISWHRCRTASGVQPELHLHRAVSFVDNPAFNFIQLFSLGASLEKYPAAFLASISHGHLRESVQPEYQDAHQSPHPGDKRIVLHVAHGGKPINP